MNPDENDTASFDATDNVIPTEDDNAEPTTYWDPDEDQDTPDEDAGEATDEAADEPEAESQEPEAEAFVDLSAKVRLRDGTVTTVAQLEKERMMQADYTRKTQENAERRKALDTDLSRLQGITQAFVDHLTSLAPPAPDETMVYRDPQGYLRQKVQHDAAMRKIQELIQLGDQTKSIAQEVSEKDTAERLAMENQRLVERFPQAATPEGRQKFFAAAADAAQAVGFSMDDLKGISDHRLFALAHWANEGMKAAKARETAKAKVANVPPAAPRKPGQPAQTNRNVEAMRKFKAQPTLRNAAKLDWI